MMWKFKPSELPVHTVIEFEEEEFTKTDSPFHGIVWVADGCPDCQGSEYDITDAQADERFTEFKIIAIPFTIIEYMCKQFSVVIEADSHDTLFVQALKHHLETEDLCEWRKGVPLKGCC